MRDLWKAGITMTGILFLLVVMVWLPVSAAGTHERAQELDTSVTVQTTPAEDATVTELNKEKLAQEVLQLKNQNEPDPFGWLRRADLSSANLNKADLSEANLENARLDGTDLRGVKGLAKEQLETCKAKGAIIDEDPTTSSSQSTVLPPPPSQSNNLQAQVAPSAQGSALTSNEEGSSATSSKPSLES